MSYVYLLHFSDPISPDHTCQHYVGYTDRIFRRIAQHRSGNGARLTEVAKIRGIEFEVVRVWRNSGRVFERWLKNQKHTSQFCPRCGGHRRIHNMSSNNDSDQAYRSWAIKMEQQRKNACMWLKNQTPPTPEEIKATLLRVRKVLSNHYLDETVAIVDDILARLED